MENPIQAAREVEWDKVGIVLNVNARKYSQRVAKAVKEMAPDAKLYVTKSIDEAKLAVQEMVDNGVETVFSGGGDGTHVGLLTSWRELVQKTKEVREGGANLPNFGMLRLGTGNGWAIAEGLRNKLQLLRGLTESGRLQIRDQAMVECEGQLFPFGGLGWDGAVINDYDSFKDMVRSKPLGRRIEGVWMYLAAVVTRTIPRELRRDHAVELKAYAKGATDCIGYVNGQPQLESIGGPDDWTQIYEGPTGLIGAGTIPYFGYNFKAFPHMGRGLNEAGRFEFRIIHYGPLASFFRLPHIWRTGDPNTGKISSFFAENIKLEYSEPIAMQLAGEPCGYKSSVEFGLSDDPVPMVVAA